MAGPKSQMQNTAGARPIAAFDFDGTITVRDSFRAFLSWRAGPAGYAAGLTRLGPEVAAYARLRDRGRLKAAMVGVFLTGVQRSVLETEALAFAEQAAPKLFRPDAVEAWRRHQADGATTVIVTASPDILVRPFADMLGADLLLGTRIAFDAQDRVVGALTGANCRGEEKVRRLREAFGPEVRLLAAYGDSAGDREMLAIAERPGLKVFTGRP